jgi:hypothetical protein
VLRKLIGSRLSDSEIRRERGQAEAWVAAYQKFEDDLIRAGTPPRSEGDYAPFYRQHGTGREGPSPFDVVMNEAEKSLRRNPAIWVVVVAVFLLVSKLCIDARRRDVRRRQSLGKTNGPPAAETRSIGSP